ncbi:MAG: DUF5110 domain-containing protein [Phycisphaerales bacterium]|nr:DUF5110 domain-containing protein [Phycisphaerales bacterium]
MVLKSRKSVEEARSWRYDHQAWLIGPGIGRFRDPADPRPDLPPFPALIVRPSRLAPLPAEFGPRPKFAGAGRRSIVRIDIRPGTTLYGTGEVAGPLIRNGRRTTCWTTDSFDYTDQTRSLYQSHPWVLAVRGDGSAFGVMAETTWRCEIDLRRGIAFRTDGPPPGVIIIDRGSPAEVVSTLAELTGNMPMPPRWALGYHQCRWSYEPDLRVRELAAEFRSRAIPCDCLWLDIDYMRGFRCFTFDPGRFPDPAALNAELHRAGFKTVWMIDPGIKAEPGYGVYDEGRSGKGGGATTHFVRRADGAEYNGEVWPGACAFPDFTRAATRAWWAGLYSDFLATGIDGVWNDMNEPAVFDQAGKAMPSDCEHDADAELGGPGPHARYRNIYGMQMVRATREGMEAARPQQRPFVLTRSNFLGGHRYAATWTGDNRSDWQHLRWSIPMALNLGLSGQPFGGPDIGGFVGEASPELFGRWMGIGSLLPFARAHSIKDSEDHEPWCFGEECERICRAALTRRYRLIPYFYTLFYTAHMTGTPVVRPVFFADPTDPGLRAVDDAFLLGSDILVSARVEPGAATGVSCSLLKGWRRFEIPGLPEHDSAQLPTLQARPGSIIPLGPALQYSDEKPVDPLTLLVCRDSMGQAEGTLYEDAGDGYGYKQGDYRLAKYRAEAGGPPRVVHIEGTRAEPTRGIEIIEV